MIRRDFMLCQICKKNQATVHYTKIINGKIEELHMCEECAANNSEFDLDSPFSFNKLWTSLIDNFQTETYRRQTDNLTCPFCGLDYSQFRKTGKFGCAQCYETFRKNLTPLLRGIHAHDKHIGKVPYRANKTIAKERKIERLKNKLNELVLSEAFEEAAKVRDEIRALEKEIGRKEE